MNSLLLSIHNYPGYYLIWDDMRLCGLGGGGGQAKTILYTGYPKTPGRLL